MPSDLAKRIVVIGGGTGNFTVLTGLKKYPFHISAIVSMSDSGGHSGRLRDELGMLPPGDVRACLVALADDEKAPIVRDLFNYRFISGSQSGASVGNLLLTALTDILGDFNKAVKAAHQLLDIKGEVLPVTLDPADLLAELEDGTILFGETRIDVAGDAPRSPIKRVWLQPKPKANPEALAVIKKADLVVLGPGDLYTSIMPNLCIPEIVEALEHTSARLVGNVNIMTKHGETDGFFVDDFVRTVESSIGRPLDFVLYNDKKIPAALAAKYRKEKAIPVRVYKRRSNWRGLDLLSVAGGLARHDSEKLAEAIAQIAYETPDSHSKSR